MLEEATLLHTIVNSLLLSATLITAIHYVQQPSLLAA